jgi:hypothetical protein
MEAPLRLWLMSTNVEREPVAKAYIRQNVTVGGRMR